MLKITLITVAMIIGIILMIFVSIFVRFLLEARNQPPSYGLIEKKYYVCREHKLLEGGIFGKGPKMKFPENTDKRCKREQWEEVDKETFKRIATDWYGIDWSKDEVYFWMKD